MTVCLFCLMRFIVEAVKNKTAGTKRFVLVLFSSLRPSWI
jgi:hypothetical protein